MGKILNLYDTWKLHCLKKLHVWRFFLGNPILNTPKRYSHFPNTYPNLRFFSIFDLAKWQSSIERFHQIWQINKLWKFKYFLLPHGANYENVRFLISSLNSSDLNSQFKSLNFQIFELQFILFWRDFASKEKVAIKVSPNLMV